MLSKFARIFFQGLMALLPIIITVYLIFLVGWWAEETMRGIVTLVLPNPDPDSLDEGETMPVFRYYRGMGLALAVILIFLFGLLLRAYLVKQLYAFAETVMQRIPVIKSIYGACKDFLGYFTSIRSKEMNQVVLVRLPNSDSRMLGLITRETFDDLPLGIEGKDQVAVYFPMSYQIGGYTLILNREQVEVIDMSIEDCLRFVLTAGIRARSGSASILDEINVLPTEVSDPPGNP